MAKRKRVTPSKTCPQCGTVNHARKRMCDSCGFRFQSVAARKLTAPPAAERAEPSTPSVADPEKEAMRFVLKLGGNFDQAKDELRTLKSNPAMDFAVRLGGIDAALRQLDRLQAELARNRG